MSGTDEVEQTAVNDSGTGAGSDTPLTHGRSGFDLEDTRRELTALRVKHGGRHAHRSQVQQHQRTAEAEPATG